MGKKIRDRKKEIRIKAGLTIDDALKEKFMKIFEKKRKKVKGKDRFVVKSPPMRMRPAQLLLCPKCEITHVVFYNPRPQYNHKCKYCGSDTEDITYFIG